MLTAEFDLDEAREVWQEEAREEGEQLGEQRGEQRVRQEMILGMLSRGHSPQAVSDFTGIPLSRVEQIIIN
ncbi:hypothetical protein AGMMS49959_15230 [Planctomycetales bacterium]|nr:hypothetical protein AGMMS49959_15230 [Planctomycetales bacterium]